QRMSGQRAKLAKPMQAFPVGSNRLTGHYPIYVLQRRVADRLSEVSVQSLANVQRQLNAIMMQEAAVVFPAAPRPDQRPSADPRFRASTSATWNLYRLAKRPAVCTLRNIWAKWRLFSQFAKASAQLRVQSKRLKQEFLHGLIDTAEQAASKGDQRTLHNIVRRLTPRNHHKASRLQSSSGQLLSSAEQLEAIVEYGNATFAAQPDEAPPPALSADLHVHDSVVIRELLSLGIGKAVPKHVAPAACWKLCAGSVGTVLGEAFRLHFKQGNNGTLQGDWKDTHVVWLPKPSKQPTTVSNMRPIGLQCPTSKILAGVLRESLLAALQPVLRSLPQFAFTKSRGTADALARAHGHFYQVAQLLKLSTVNRFQQQAGLTQPKCQGGVCLSLDLSKAFDCVQRGLIYQSLRRHGVSEVVIQVIQQLHFRARYHFEVSEMCGHTCTTNGIKQGCKIAPYLWSYFTVAFMLLLRDQRDLTWLQRVMTLFADDCWGAWVIKSRQDFKQAKLDLELILETLETLKMTVNYQKTAILLHLVGKEAAGIRRQATYRKAGTLYLRVTVHGRDCGIPIKEEHEYLGSIVSYHRRVEKNVMHRLKACQARYQGLRKTLNGVHHLSQQHRIRLWQACVCTSAMYSLPVVGLSKGSLGRLVTELTRHLRAITRQPVHLTHIPTIAVWTKANLAMPGWTLQCLLDKYRLRLRHTAETSPDVTVSAVAMQHLEDVSTTLEDILRQEAQYATMPLVQQAILSVDARPPEPIAVPPAAHDTAFEGENVEHLPLIMMYEEEMDPEIDASIFAHCYNIGPPQQAMTAMTNRAQKRQRPEHQLRQMPMGMRMHPQLPQAGMGMATYSQQQNGDPMRLMGRLLLQQEETIARLRKDKCFVLFLKHEQEGVLRPLMQVSKEWHLKQAEATT
ncbi:Pol, partial [Symbiodinium necroappetens]